MEMIYHYAKNYHKEYSEKSNFPTLRFYYDMVKIVFNAARVSCKGLYTAERWVHDSYCIGQAMEKLGTNITIEGYENLEQSDKPCVFIGNHMSTLETFFLPSIIQPKKDVTFIVKKSLLNYPGLGPVLKSRNPIALTRKNPREDLVNVLENGQKILKSGRSIIIFPQGTRFPEVNIEDFSTLGIKLAKKANVPIIPLALKTDAWGTNRLTKNFGAISPQLPVHIRFGQTIEIQGNGKEEHAQCMEFISKSFQEFSNAIKK
jgi:1-acyl-sn-glycerol-3-phosphate acyltransferase